MESIRTLMDEHRVIESLLDALWAFSGRLQAEGGTQAQALGQFVELISEFADRIHHGKEEDILFQVMAEGGFPTESGPIAVMLMDHDQGRSYVARMRSAAEHDGDWGDDLRKDVVAAARGYVELLRSHIYKEDNILYPMADQHLDDALRAQVDERCRLFEAEHEEEKRHYLALARDLAARFA